MKPVKILGIVSLCVLPIIGTSSARAATFNAFASYSLPAPPGGTSFDESDFSNPPSGTPASASAGIVAGYAPLATVVNASATASADGTDLRAGASLAISDFDTSILGEGFFVNSSAGLSDTYTTSSLAELFASPVFRISGTLFSDSASLRSTVRLFSSQFDEPNLFFRTGTPTLAAIDEIIVPDPISLALPTFMRFSFSANVESSGISFTAGDHAGVADFSSTISLLGFALFEDAEMTRPVIDGVTVSGGDGSLIDVVDLQSLNPIPLPAAAWLFGTALIGLIGFGRRKKGI